jgi:hypothetical protein
VLAWAVVATSVPLARSKPADPDVPAVVKAATAPEWDAKFAGQKGWIGGDGVYSAVLGPNRVLWLFGDTLLGTVKDGGRPGAVMVNNTLGIQARRGVDTPICFVTGRPADGKATAVFLPADGKGWFWPQAAIRVGDRLFVFLARIDKTAQPGAFGFQHVGQGLAVVENPDDGPARWRVTQHQVPFAEFGSGRSRSWGSAVLAEGDHLYVYGYDEPGKGIGKRQLTVARVPAGKVGDFRAWQFRSAGGWSDRPADAAPLVEAGLATEFSVSRVPGGKGYVAVYTENGLGDQIVGRFAGAPEGPWSASVLLYRCPELAKDKGVFSYAAKAHPWAAAGNDLVVSYCVNTWEFAQLFRDEQVYRPKFVRVELRPPK